ncbi:hypothetical protein BDR07DRAFT_1373845 [Suillus spraguei]|nr:hypothetical protein BDR07DRAFT_1373845 [Suillus spraguei]
MTEKNPCKQAASNIAEADGPKQARVRNKSPAPVIGQWKSKAPLSAVQLFDSDSDDVKPDESDDSSSDLNSGGVDLFDNKLEESDDVLWHSTQRSSRLPLNMSSLKSHHMAMEAFFSNELAAGLKWHDHLTSILDDHPDELELPVAMVALTSAAYSSEKYDRDFNSEMYGGSIKHWLAF